MTTRKKPLFFVWGWMMVTGMLLDNGDSTSAATVRFSCDFEEDLCGFIPNSEDYFLRSNRDKSPANNVPPRDGEKGKNFIFREFYNTGLKNITSRMTSPMIQVAPSTSTQSCLKFWLHMRAEQEHEFIVFTANAADDKTPRDRFVGDAAPTWSRKSVNLEGSFKIVLELVTRGWSFTRKMQFALDDLVVEEGQCNDQATTILPSSSTPAGPFTSPDGTVHNHSSSTTSLPSTVSTTSETATTTTQMPPQTTTVVLPTSCVSGDFKEFCTKAPTASLLYQTGTQTKEDVYVLISGYNTDFTFTVGNCAMKYKIGTDANNIQVIDPTLVKDGKPNPVDIRELYPGYDAFGLSLPITFAYLGGASGPVYFSNFAKPTTASACAFPGTNPTKPCDGSIWLTAPLTGVLSTSAPNSSFATVVPQNQFYVYVPATKQLCLSNTGRPAVALSAKQCLNLTNELLNPYTKNEITTVTAIQYVNHEKYPALVIFGTNATGAPLIAFGDAIETPVFHPPIGPISFNTYGGSFPVSTYTSNMKCQ